MRHFVCLEDAGGGGDFAWLYKTPGSSVFWLVQQEHPVQMVHLIKPATGDGGGKVSFEWEKGTWGHLLATWSGNQLSLYVNGKYCSVAYVPAARLMRKLGPTSWSAARTRAWAARRIRF